MILLDTRVGNKKGDSHDLTAALEAQGLTVQPTVLEYGDMAFIANGPDGAMRVGMELKTMSDLINSMESGRLGKRQIPGMLADGCEHIWLIVQDVCRVEASGCIQVRGKRGWETLGRGQKLVFARDVMNYITSLQVQAGIHISHTNDQQATADEVARIYTLLDKPWDAHRSMKGVVRNAPPAMSLRGVGPVEQWMRETAERLPGIGWDRARAIAAHFDSGMSMWMASEQEWLEVEGIGKKLARDIYARIREHKGEVDR